MKISEFGTVVSLGGPKRRGNVASGAFVDLLSTGASESAGQPAAMNDVASAASLGNLLTLQEIPQEEFQRSKLLGRGKNLLDALERLRGQLLHGRLSPQIMRDLTRQLAEQRQTVMDPALGELMEEIELRAAVELAKLEMAVRPREASRDAGPTG